MVKFLLKFLLFLLSGIIGLILLANVWIVLSTADRIFTDPSQLTSTRVGLVLGTSKYNREGSTNEFFKNRIATTAQLYNRGIITHIIVSGDNRTVYYNEPKYMKNALTALGIPEDAITLDQAGTRTIDSIIRCKEVFGQEEFIIISQGFHCHRAVFIADRMGVKTQGISADMPSSHGYIKVLIREWIARPFAIMDLYLFSEPYKK